jgi:hypothetical protein
MFLVLIGSYLIAQAALLTGWGWVFSVIANPPTSHPVVECRDVDLRHGGTGDGGKHRGHPKLRGTGKVWWAVLHGGRFSPLCCSAYW